MAPEDLARPSRAEALLARARRVLVIDTISWRPHLETSMEVALVAQAAGAKVRYLNLRTQLPAVEDASWLPRRFELNTVRAARGARLLAAAGIEIGEAEIGRADVAAAASSARAMLQGCPDAASLCGLRHEGFADIGWGVLASVVELTRNPHPSLRADARLFRGFLASSLLVYAAAREAMLRYAPDVVVLFNGRYATTRAILAAAQAQGVQPVIHERGCDKAHYWLATESIHDPDYLQRCIREFWRPELAAAGEEFFRGRRERIERSWRSYTKGQVQGRLPPAMQDGSKWVVFFTSSEDEYVAIGDKYRNESFPVQRDAILAVAGIVERMPGYRLCVRMHPNIATKSKEQIAYWRQLKVPGGVVVGPQEDFDSYAILDKAHVVCSYGSTVGIEATYWGKPSLLMRRCIYDRLGATSNAGTLEDVRAFLAAPATCEKLGALMYGAFFARFGTRYRHYEPEDLFRGRILGARLDPAPATLWRTMRGRR